MSDSGSQHDYKANATQSQLLLFQIKSLIDLEDILEVIFFFQHSLKSHQYAVFTCFTALWSMEYTDEKITFIKYESQAYGNRV